MLNVKRNELIHVLNFLEEKAEPAYQKALKEAKVERTQDVNTEELFNKATRAQELERTINALLDQVDVLQAEKDQNTSEILNVVDKIKGKSIKVGNILLMVHETIQNNPQKVTFKYKHILDGILEIYDIEQKFLSRLKKKFRSITPASKHVSKELEIQQEAEIKKLTKLIETKTGKKIQLQEGNLIDWIKEKGNALVSFFKMWYDSIAGKVDKLEAQAQAIGITSNKNRGDFGTPDKFTPKTQALGEGKKKKLKEGQEKFKQYYASILDLMKSSGIFSDNDEYLRDPGSIIDKYKRFVYDSFEDNKPFEVAAKEIIRKSKNQADHSRALDAGDRNHKLAEGDNDLQKSEVHKLERGAFVTINLKTATYKGIVLAADKMIGKYKVLVNMDGQMKIASFNYWNIKLEKQLKKDVSVEQYTSFLKKQQEPSMVEAMNRPDENRAMGKRPVLDADQHVNNDQQDLKTIWKTDMGESEGKNPLKESEFAGMDPKKLIIGKKYVYRKNRKNNPKILTYLGGPKEYPRDFSVDTKTGKRKVTIPTWEIISFLTPVATGYEPTEDEGSIIEGKQLIKNEQKKNNIKSTK